ncbi:MAG: hypothetical protein U0176_27290 [Bacteroidia bacterium]
MIRVKSLFAAAVLAVTGLSLQAQTLEEAIAKNLPNLDPRKPSNELMATIAQFDLAAGQFPDQWAAHYYAGYSKVILTYTLPEDQMQQKDMVLDEADAYFAKVKEMGVENSETYILGAMIANARLAVDGQNRWQKYGAIFRENLEKAKSLNADNPRIYHLQGTSLFWTPAMFGGGKQAALPFFQQAKPLFEKESKASLLVPYWGQDQNEWYISECNKPDEEPVKEEPKGKKEKEKKNKEK